jgi:hypothetical protein
MPKSPSAIYTRDGQRFPIVGPISVVRRERARYSVALGWNYRFRSGEVWLLIPLENALAFEFEQEPEGQESSH